MSGIDGVAEARSDFDSEGLADWVKPELLPEERLLWAGRPIDGKIDIPLFDLPPAFIFALFSTVIACCVGIYVTNRDPILPSGFWATVYLISLISTLTALISGVRLAMDLISRLGVRQQIARQSYAITDRRVIVWQPKHRSRGVEIRSLARGRLGSVRRVQHPDGSGDVLFRSLDHATPQTEGFFRIPDVRHVEEILREAMNLKRLG